MQKDKKGQKSPKDKKGQEDQEENVVVVLPEQEFFLPIKVACMICGVTRTTLDRWRRDGIFPELVKINGNKRVSSRDLDDFINRQNPKRLRSSRLNREAAAFVKGLMNG